MSIAKAVGKEALALSEIKTLKTRVKAIVKERKVKVRGKTETRQEKKATVTSGQTKALVAETPALTTMILRSLAVRLRERGKKRGGSSPPPYFLRTLSLTGEKEMR